MPKWEDGGTMDAKTFEASCERAGAPPFETLPGEAVKPGHAIVREGGLDGYWKMPCGDFDPTATP